MKKTIECVRKVFFGLILTIVFIGLLLVVFEIVKEIFAQKKDNDIEVTVKTSKIEIVKESIYSDSVVMAYAVPEKESVTETTEKVITKKTGVFATGREDVEPGLLFVRIVKGCQYDIDKTCLRVRSGPGNKYPGFYSIRIDAFFEVKEIILNDKDEIWYKIRSDSDPKRIAGGV